MNTDSELGGRFSVDGTWWKKDEGKSLGVHPSTVLG